MANYRLEIIRGPRAGAEIQTAAAEISVLPRVSVAQLLFAARSLFMSTTPSPGPTFLPGVLPSGADSFQLFNGDYSAESIAIECVKFLLFWFSGVV